MNHPHVGATWAGTHTFGASRLHRPTSVEEVSRLVADSARIRALGTRHSFNDLADSDQLLTLVDLDPAFEIDEDASTVTVASGTRYGVLAAWLERQGYALHNMGSLPHISIAGATATATHGSGDGNGVLSTAVAAVELVTADGSILTIERGHEDFAGVVPSVGALGVITRITLDVEPTFRVRQAVFQNLDWETVLVGLDDAMAAGYSVSLFTTWDEPTISHALVKTRLDGETDQPHNRFFEAFTPDERDRRPATEEGNRTALNTPGPWCDRLPHFVIDSTPSYGSEIQSEYFVDRVHGADALRTLRELADEIAPHLITSEIRSTAADELWLSMAYRRPSLAIHFTWRNEPESVARLLPLIESALSPFEPRPHWGKVFAMEADTIGALYPRIADFRSLARRMDPTRKFHNGYLSRVLEL